MTAEQTYPEPQGGGSFIIAYRAKEKHVLVIGGGSVAAGRVFNALDADMRVTVLSPELNQELQYRYKKSQIKWINDSFKEEYLDGVDMVLSTIDDPVESKNIVDLCRQKSIFVNAADINDLCDFWFMSMHRDGPLQIAVSTNSRAPRLANKIRLQIATLLPQGTGKAIDNIGKLRSSIRKVDPSPNNSRKRMSWLTELCDYWSMHHLSKLDQKDINILLESYIHQADVKKIQLKTRENITKNLSNESLNTANIDVLFEKTTITDHKTDLAQNTLNGVPSINDSTNAHLADLTKTIPNREIKLQNIQDNDIIIKNLSNKDVGAISQKSVCGNSILDKYLINDNCISRSNSNIPNRGSIALIGAGLGSPDLLTIQAIDYLQKADLILADRLIPKAIFSVISNAEIFIARKYPGLADAAQNELNERGLIALKEGKTVVRLKQGDPFVYGRAGEEILFFEKHGYECTIVPGLSSALTAACLNRIPVTHRGVADQVLILSGNNRFNQLPEIPNYLKTRTLVFLMVAKKLNPVCDLLLKHNYPLELPVSILENAGCFNQKKIKGTLSTINEITQISGINLPALLVVGWSNDVIPDFQNCIASETNASSTNINTDVCQLEEKNVIDRSLSVSVM
ncbi:hypothetical protein BB561_001331 [Smittium simulii]|uniref:precorrin-2 dehydrogenase n=1 Tax=Smittium simulii TaxID=133385 RepID=A0A2T9YV59_9FUNG|nr:hypothetical protein BB561_001331 [Smittium simulii]